MKLKRRRITRGGLTLVVMLAACANDTDAGSPEPTVSVSTETTTEVRVTPQPTTVTATSPVADTTTTVAPSTTSIAAPAPPSLPPGPPVGAPVVAALSTPIAPPPDMKGQEPVLVIGSIEIPKLGVVDYLYEGIRLTTLDRGPGHWPRTAMPGHTGNVVVAGHRTSHGKPFRNVDQLIPGDEVIFTTDAGRFVYIVVSTEIVKPDAMRVISQTLGFTATLTACHPVGSTDERIIVHLDLPSV